MQTILNIGLARSSQSTVEAFGPLNVAVVTECLKSLFGRAFTAHVYVSDSEPTLVVNTFCPVSSTQVEKLAKAFDQDAIAFFDVDTGKGHLVGPRASAWGSFNAEYFLLPNGERLAQAALAA